MSAPGTEITLLLERIAGGDRAAVDALAPLIYRDLRKVAQNYVRKERIGHTLQPTALVHEAYIRIIGLQRVSWESRTHFIAVAATLMRNILIDYARRRNVRAEGHLRADKEEHLARMGQEQAEELVALDDALSELATVNPRQAQIVEMKFFGGLSVEEISQVLKLSDRTVKRDWADAKEWLKDHMIDQRRR